LSTPSPARERPAAPRGAPIAPDRRVAIFWLFATTLIWGSTFFAVKGGIEATAAALGGAEAGWHAPSIFLILRFGLAAAILAFFPGAARELARSRQARRDSFAIAIPFTAGFVLQVYGLRETTATISAFLTSTYVLFVPLMAVALTRKAPPARLQAGVLLATAGTVLLTMYGRIDLPAEAPARAIFGRGELYSLLCAVAFAAVVHMTDVYSRRTGAGALTLGSLVVTIALVAGGLALTSAGRAALAPASFRATLAARGAAGAIAYTATFGTVLALFAMYRYQRAVSPTRAAIIYAAEPAAAAAFAYLFTGEACTPLGIVGCGMILIGNLIAELRK
jgi:drug/metabolite transporter (DMT)-like permease